MIVFDILKRNRDREDSWHPSDEIDPPEDERFKKGEDYDYEDDYTEECD